MPELPDVEGFRRIMTRHGTGKPIRRVEVRDSRSLRNVRPSHFSRRLKGREFRRPDRKGKWLLAHTDGPTVLLHFGMTGGLSWERRGTPLHTHDRVIFGFEDGELRFRDMRKLQGIWLAESEDSVARILGHQGPDALAIDRRQFDERLQRRRGRVKPVLMNQRVIAGLGNLLVDEILWQARIHPQRRTDDLRAVERSRIYQVMRRVLHESVPSGYVPGKRGWLTAARAAGANAVCPRCHSGLSRGMIGGRTSYWCPRCQPATRH